MNDNNNNTITVTINKGNLTYITSRLKQAYKIKCYFEFLQIFADKYSIMQDKVNNWIDIEYPYYTKYNTICSLLHSLNLNEYLLDRDAENALCNEARVLAIKKLGLEDKELGGKQNDYSQH